MARLQQLGLNEQQARAYLALLDLPLASVNELAKLSRVPRAKLYEVMEALNKKGLVDVVPETPQRFRANPVSALYDTRVEELRAEEAELRRTVGELVVDFVPQTKEDRGEAERDFVHISHGRTHFAVLARALVGAATKSITVVGDRLLLARLRLYEDLVQAMAEKAANLPLRILVPDNVVDQVDGRRLHLDELSENVRRLGQPLGDATVLVRDQEEYLVTRFLPNDLHPSRGSDRVEVGRDAEIAALWHRLATNLWDTARPWKPSRG